MKNNLKLIVMENCLEFGKKVDFHLQKTYQESMIVPISNSRFSNGEGKITIDGSIRDQDLYILSDVGNYDISYSMHGRDHFMSPDEHFQDIKRVISATSGYASKITVVMPLLYQSRQHKRKGRESLDCAIALQELERLGVNHIVTFDCHDPNVSNAVPLLPFESFYPTNVILSTLLEKEKENLENLFVVGPDFGAMERADYYAKMLGCSVGAFSKKRDLTKVVNGKNPILEHTYLGDSVEGKDVLVVDDMIASGSSMIEVGEELKKRGARNVYLVASFALLTEGITPFVEAYQKGVFDKLYSTNLSYVPESIKNEVWYEDVDGSKQLSEIIETLHEKRPMSPLFNGQEEILKKTLGGRKE